MSEFGVVLPLKASTVQRVVEIYSVTLRPSTNVSMNTMVELVLSAENRIDSGYTNLRRPRYPHLYAQKLCIESAPTDSKTGNKSARLSNLAAKRPNRAGSTLSIDGLMLSHFNSDVDTKSRQTSDRRPSGGTFTAAR